MTLKAMRALGEADVVAHFAKAGNASHSRAIVAQHLRAGVIELPLYYPVTTELPTCSDGYRDAHPRFLRRCRRRRSPRISKPGAWSP